ncbi:MAG: GWxTD domain-containing protein [Acidobacteria bacterium]|nr:GWxTD domain-containing protein [Acidobacteriota bacterium]
MKFEKIRKFTLPAILAAIAAVPAVAQKTSPTPDRDPSDKPRNVKSEMKDVYKKWLERDVPYIITSEEKRAFKALATDEERENFIENFWRRRDPNPDTEENEFREEYYERIAYANEHFASGIPGWRTDRGRVYIAWGKPDSVESHPTGEIYDRPSYEGGGSTTTYAYETWYYRHLDGIGDGLEIEFVDPTGTGEYRLARDAFEKDAMAMVPGGGLTASELMGNTTKAMRDGVYYGNGSYIREQDNPFRRLEIQNGLFSPKNNKFSDLATLATDSPVIDSNPIDFDIRIDYFRQSESQVMTTFTVQADNKELKFVPEGGLETAKMNIFGRITSVTQRRSGTFEDSVSTNATAAELADMRDRKSVYQKAIALTPGIYKVDVVVRDVNTGTKGVRSLGFTVPKYDEKKLSTSTLILASKLRTTTDRDIGAAFVIGNAKVIPNMSGVFSQGQDVGFYMQVYNAQIDQTTLRPAVDVTYTLMKDGKQVLTQPEDWSGLSDSGQRLTLARILPGGNLPVGAYELKIDIKDRVSGQEIKNSEKFTVVK